MKTMRFHRRCGDRVTLLNENSTAVRNFVEFNHGLILSWEPLKDDVMFEVCIDRKVNVWNGSLEIGVTTLDPEFMELPATATKLRNTAWIMSGSSIVKDGVTLVNSYGPELDTLREGDCVGVMRTSKGELMFYINGRCLGVAESDMPPNLYAVIDLYGQCVQVSIMHSNEMRPIMEISMDQIQDPNNDDTLTSGEMDEAGLPPDSFPGDSSAVYVPMTSDAACALVAQDYLRFHPRCGILVKLSANNKSAERARPLDDYNNGVVMTHRPLYDNELFEIRIDRLVDKWSGSIEVGVTAHNPATIRFPSTMTNMDTGTIMMSGCKVLLNGHGTCMEYGNFNLDELREGDTVGMVRKANGELHYYINGVDQGVATDRVEQQVWGVIDLYGMTVKVSIVDPCEDLDSNVNTVPHLMDDSPDMPPTNRFRPAIDEDSLLFHTLRDSNIIIINDGKTAHRPNAFEYFNNGIVMTNRTLRTNELFQVRLDLVIPKWAGSIEIGVTQHSSNDIQFPFKMSNAKSGTWAITGEDVVRDGTIVIPQYVRSLNRLTEGDTVGVMCKDMGILHFFVNGVDQGPAAFNVPEYVFGIIDLYGRVAQATIVDTYTPPSAYSPESPLSTESNATIFPEMCFHRVHGRNARLSRNRLTTWRATIYSEFNDAVLFSSRPLRECDMFELRIDKMVDCWIGSLEIGSGSYAAMAIFEAGWKPNMSARDAIKLVRDAITAGIFNDLGSGSNIDICLIRNTGPALYLRTYEEANVKVTPDAIIGVTAIRPDDLEANGGVGAVAGTATDLNWDTYILSGAAMMKDGECVRSGYPLDLDTLTVGSRVGMMWHADRSLHYYLDGMDMGKAWYVPHLNIYAVVDLYGQCTQVTILQNEERTFNYNGCSNSDNSMLSNSRALSSPPPPYWSFSEYCGDNICLMHDYSIARRLTTDPMAAIVFSSAHLAVGEIFEIQIVECKHGYAGSFRMGVTDINILNANVNRSLPPSISCLPHFTAYIDGSYMKYSLPGSRNQDVLSFVPSFEWLRPGDRVGLKKASDGRVVVYYNSEPLDLAFENVPDKVYVVMEIYGQVTKIQAVTRGNVVTTLNQATSEELVRNYVQLVPNDENQKLLVPTAVMDNSQLPEEQDAHAPAPDEVDPKEPQMADPQIIEEQIIEEIKIIDNSESIGEMATKEICEGTLITLGEGEVASESDPTLVETEPSEQEPERRRRPLPYTFHYIHGKNIKLCSSDTVAMRVAGFNHGVAVVSQPLRRGNTFRFRVDKIVPEWMGSVGIGAMGILPNEETPSRMTHTDPPNWVLVTDMIIDNGQFASSDIGIPLDDVVEQTVLSLHFRLNSELVVEMDGSVLGPIGTIPHRFNQIFPTIDLYGKVIQVSALLHPHIVTSGLSLDLPIIAENLREESLAEMELLKGENTDEAPIHATKRRPKKKVKAYSQDNPIEDELDPIVVTAGPSTMPDPLPLASLPDSQTVETDGKQRVIKCKKAYPQRISLHHSLILSETPADNNEMVNRCIQKSHSTHSFCQMADELSEANESLRHTFSVGSRVGDDAGDVVVREHVCDTNIRHNDRYPEASDVDNLDNEIMDALTLETGNLPDLTEEQSSSIDESTRRDDIWPDSLSVENLNYLNRVLCLDQEGLEGQSLEAEWEASGESCEHLHMVLKYWNYLVLPYPELRQAVSWGQVRCYCANCQPDAHPPLAGWVRIERIDGVGAAQRAFWHVVRSTLGSAQAAGDERGPARRPPALAPAPCAAPPLADIWFDEEGKPHLVVLAIEIDVEGSEAENDRLLAFLIYLKPHVVFNDDNPLSLEE